MKHRVSLSLSLPIAFVAATFIACGFRGDEEVESTRQTAARIVGGAEAQAGAWPGTVALYMGSTQACGGALVADEWVLTAGHCVSPSSTNGGISKVVINRHRLSSTDGETRTVKKAIRHAGFNSSTLDNDLALLQLSSKTTAPLSKLVTSAQMANIVADATVIVVGWGRMGEGGGTSDVLREVSVPIISNAQCRTYQSYDEVTDNQICAGLPNGGRDSCQGDSGGPLFMKLGSDTVQIGLVSWGIGCARPNAPGVYTRIGNYLGWMSQQSGGAIGGAPTDGGVVDSGSGTDAASAAFAPFEEAAAVAKGEEKAYSYDAPAGTYRVELTGTNDADLYVKVNEPATSTAWDCRPYATGSNEQCEVTLDTAGKLHVMVRGYATGTSSFTVKGRKL
jgi:secreted trypsin-like serine protease